MATNRTNPKVDAFLKEAKKWQDEMGLLRKILLACELTEEWKWNKPCYSFQGSNLVVVLGLKEYCALLFCKGALLKDATGLLVKAGENTQAARQLRFTSVREITEKESVLKAYIKEAIKAEKAGLKVVYKKIAEHTVPEELQKKLSQSAEFKSAFGALTPGRQRAYYIYFTAAKQSVTRESRIEKCRPRILQGKGLNAP